MDYWNELVTQKSFEALQELQRRKLKFVLIGGWAAWLYTKALKSKDVDIIVGFEELGKLKQLFGLRKNTRLRKYGFNLGEIDIDVYVEYYSRLAIPAEDAAKEAVKAEGFTTVKPEVLLILKQGAEAARKESEKGFKDRLDIMNLLLKANIDLREYNRLLKKHSIQHFKQRLIEIVQGFREGNYLDLNPRELKKKKQGLLGKIKSA